jgi:hypothetical protein
LTGSLFFVLGIRSRVSERPCRTQGSDCPPFLRFFPGRLFLPPLVFRLRSERRLSFDSTGLRPSSRSSPSVFRGLCPKICAIELLRRSPPAEDRQGQLLFCFSLSSAPTCSRCSHRTRFPSLTPTRCRHCATPTPTSTGQLYSLPRRVSGCPL